jgi:hypothetical protein
MIMWVRSQDKKVLASVKFLKLGEVYESGIKKFEIEDGAYTFGIYETEKRALAVLDEIQMQLQSCTGFDKIQGPTRTFMQPVFEMPEE